MITISTYQYSIQQLPWDAYVQKIERLVEEAAQNKTQILLLPEYAGVEIAPNHKTDKDCYVGLQTFLPFYIELFGKLAQKHRMYIQPGTTLVLDNGLFYNRAYFFAPNGKYTYQDKLQLTQYEKKSSLIRKGTQQRVFETTFGKVGIAICYDSEFPRLVSNLIDAGAWLILVPSYTNSLAGYNRVSISCRARAIENQCYVATSFVVGKVEFGDEPHDETFGESAIYSPADVGFPANGVVARCEMNKLMMTSAVIEQDLIDKVRQNGAVHNYLDSRSDMKSDLPIITLV